MKRSWLLVGLALLLAESGIAQEPNAVSRAAMSAPKSPEPVGPIPGPPRPRTPMPNPFADDPAALQGGRQLFVNYNCSGCHGDHAGGGMGPSLRDEDWIYGGQPADIYDSIAHGRAHGMPAWETLLPPQNIWQIVSYIKSLRTSKEPQPPQ